jgi:hypothetical protein
MDKFNFYFKFGVINLIVKKNNKIIFDQPINDWSRDEIKAVLKDCDQVSVERELNRYF